MTSRRLWLRVLAGAGGAVAVLALLDVPPPAEPVPALPSLGFGVGCGTALFIALAGQTPPLPHLSDPGRTLMRLGLIGALAAAEEIIWRWLVLGALATATAPVVALAASTIGFAATHRHGRKSHLVTGATFGLVYLATGRLVACIAAHATYNIVLAETLVQARPREEPA
ncbi:MAG: CPBP family intramembrane metalloprotease [Actinobacteria bacterium]|nr:CPBP family intramembrane metalloprotease [Actinomycetota bacterium]